jgi:hypothetical protein
LAPGFLAKAESPIWGESFVRASEFYVAGNMASPIEIGIILAQSGLELLAWSTFVRTGLVSPKDFTYKWKAHGQIANLLRRFGIPTAIPSSSSHLGGTIPGYTGGAEGPERFAYVRNRIVHPPKGHASTGTQEGPLLIEAWRLGLHYLELCLLHLARYHGTIRSRVHRDERPVPWDRPRLPW